MSDIHWPSLVLLAWGLFFGQKQGRCRHGALDELLMTMFFMTLIHFQAFKIFKTLLTVIRQPAIRGELGRPSMEEVRERNMRLNAVGTAHRMPACVIIMKIQARKKPRLKGVVAGLLAACRWPILFGMYQKNLALIHK